MLQRYISVFESKTTKSQNGLRTVPAAIDEVVAMPLMQEDTFDKAEEDSGEDEQDQEDNMSVSATFENTITELLLAKFSIFKKTCRKCLEVENTFI